MKSVYINGIVPYVYWFTLSVNIILVLKNECGIIFFVIKDLCKMYVLGSEKI